MYIKRDRERMKDRQRERAPEREKQTQSADAVVFVTTIALDYTDFIELHVVGQA